MELFLEFRLYCLLVSGTGKGRIESEEGEVDKGMIKQDKQ